MTKIQNSKPVSVIWYWNLRFFCNLWFAIWNFYTSNTPVLQNHVSALAANPLKSYLAQRTRFSEFDCLSRAFITNGSGFDSGSYLLSYMVCNFLLRCANSLDRSIAPMPIDEFGCSREAKPCHTRGKNANVPELKSDGPWSSRPLKGKSKVKLWTLQ